MKFFLRNEALPLAETPSTKSACNDDGDFAQLQPRKQRFVTTIGLVSAVALLLVFICGATFYKPETFAFRGNQESDVDQHSNPGKLDENLDLIQPELRQLDEELNAEGKEGTHFGKTLLPPSKSDIWGYVLATLGLMIAAGGGIGGGGLLVPIYILVMGFGPKQAIPLSNVTVFGGAVANTILNVRKRHPLADRPLIDWDLILVMEPSTIAGALIGAHLNKLLSPVVIVIMLVVILFFTAYKTLVKARKMYAVESSGYTECTTQECNETKAQGALKTLLEDERTSPKANIGIIVAMFFTVLFINVMKGGGAFPSPLGIQCGSLEFWISEACIVLCIFLVSFYARTYLVGRTQKKDKLGYKYAEGDIHWDERTTVIYPTICTLAGFVAGLFGIGGGIVKGPLMLAMEVHPAVASATSACMILFTSSTATTSFAVFGLLVPDYAVVCFLMGFVATLVGQNVMAYLLERYQRNSYIAFSIGIVVLLSAIFMTMESLETIYDMEVHSDGHHVRTGLCRAHFE